MTSTVCAHNQKRIKETVFRELNGLKNNIIAPLASLAIEILEIRSHKTVTP